MDTNNTQSNIFPLIGGAIILALLVLLGLFVFNMVKPEAPANIQAQDIPTKAVETVSSEDLVTSEAPAPDATLEQLNEELSVVVEEIENEDLFGLEQLDAELVEFTELDDILNFEL